MELQTIEIEQEIRNYLTQTFLFGNSESLSNDVPLLGSVIDSQGAIELVTFIQQRFDIEVQDDEVTINNLSSVKTVTALIEKKLRGK